jgi:hypothetical protein
MPYETRSPYEIREEVGYSRFSRPRPAHDDGTYEIHLVKASDPHYIPADMEIWPLYYRAIGDALTNYPEAFKAASEAYLKLRQEHAGKQKRDL